MSRPAAANAHRCAFTPRRSCEQANHGRLPAILPAYPFDAGIREPYRHLSQPLPSDGPGKLYANCCSVESSGCGPAFPPHPRRIFPWRPAREVLRLPATPRSLRAAKSSTFPRATVRVSGRYWDSSGEEAQAQPIDQPAPEYPPAAQMDRIQESVGLDVIIAKDGTMRGVKVLSGNPLLVEAAVSTVQRWRYAPTVRNSKPWKSRLSSM